MAITAAQVKELREMTGAGMMDCKKALTATEGDMDKAVEFLRWKEDMSFDAMLINNADSARMAYRVSHCQWA